jgi:hypothetical protein
MYRVLSQGCPTLLNPSQIRDSFADDESYDVDLDDFHGQGR